MEVKMNHESITEIESLENQLPRWEKWLYLCYGASFTMFVNAIVRSFERSYLNRVFVVSAEELKLMGGSISVPDSVVQHVAASLNAPWWSLVCGGILMAMLFPGVVLSLHSGWRKVSIHKRLNLMLGFFISAWIMLLSLGVQDPHNVADGYNFLLLGSAIAIGVGFWRLRRKQTKAEVIFP
jgi:hypothetical protein